MTSIAAAPAPAGDAPRMVATAADLRALSSRRSLLGGRVSGPAGARVSVRVPGMTADAARRWERRLGMWLAACGCETGSVLALSAMTWRVVVAAHAWPIGWPGAAASVGWVLGAAVAGKVLGLAVARLLLERDLERLRREMDALAAVRP